MTSEYLPTRVREDADMLRVSCDVEPVITRIAVDRWRITITNTRVTMTLDLRQTRPGRCVWVTSTLTVDGVRRELTHGPEHFARVFKDPDNELDRRINIPPASTVLETQPVADAPKTVRSAYQMAVDQLGDGLDIQVGTSGPGYWAVTVNGTAGILRMNYYITESGRCVSPEDHPFDLIVNGEDRTAEMGGRMDRAMALLAGTPRENSSTPSSPVAAGAGAARTNSVEVRRAAVIRN